MSLAAYCLHFCLSLLPMQADREPVSTQDLLRDLASKDIQILQAARSQTLKLQPGPRVRLLIQGMQLENTKVAAWCALQLSWTELSNAEAPRFLELLWSQLTQPRTEADLEQFKSLLGTTEVGALLEKLPPSGNRDLPGKLLLTQLRFQLRPDHIPALCRIFLGEDLELANTALERICALLSCGDRYRDLIARTLLLRKAELDLRKARNAHGLGPTQSIVLPEKTDGYPPLLHACLVHFFDKEQVTLRGRPWKAQIDDWLWRWAREIRPGPSDRELLLKLLTCKQIPGENLALQGLGWVGKPVDRETIRSYGQSTPGGKLTAWASLVRLGDEKALQQLEERAASDVMALGFLLELAPKRARPLIEEVLREGSVSKVQEILNLPREDAALRLGITLRWDRDYAWLENLLRRGNIPILHRVALLVRVPAFRSQSLLFCLADAGLFRDLTAEETPALYQGDMVEFLALLETSSRRQARRFLEALAQHEEKSIRNYAVDMLLRLGAPGWEDRLIERVRWAQKANVDAQRILLGRTRTDKIRAWLTEIATSEETTSLSAMRGLGIACGLPAALTWLDEDDVLDEKDARHVLQALREDHAVEALLFWLQKSTALFPERPPAADLGLVKDPRITAFLVGLRNQRELGLYAWATGQLALQGHAEARAEQEAVLRIGRYRWIEEASAWSLLLDPDLSRLPDLVRKLENNGCAYASVTTMFEDLLGLDFENTGFYNTPQRMAVEWWKRSQGRLRYSHILDRYLIVAKSHRKSKKRDD